MSIGKKSILFFHLSILAFCTAPAFGELIGQVSNERVYHLGVGVSGEVSSVPEERGRVRQGALLLTLHDAHLKAALNAAESALALADARLAQANRAFERDAELYDEGSLSMSELEESENNQKQHRHIMDLHSQVLSERMNELALSRILAPEEGFVIDWSVHEGERVNPDVPPTAQILFGAGEKVLEVALEKTENQVPEAGTTVSVIDMTGVARPATIQRIVVSALKGVVRLYLENPGTLPEYGSYVRIIR